MCPMAHLHFVSPPLSMPNQFELCSKRFLREYCLAFYWGIVSIPMCLTSQRSFESPRLQFFSCLQSQRSSNIALELTFLPATTIVFFLCSSGDFSPKNVAPCQLLTCLSNSLITYPHPPGKLSSQETALNPLYSLTYPHILITYSCTRLPVSKQFCANCFTFFV